MNKLIAFVACALVSVQGLCQNRPEPELLFNQKDLEKDQSTSVQGTAIWGDYLFSLRDQGYCHVINLKKKSLVAEFPLASQDSLNHANDAFFSGRFYSKEDKFPLLYVSQCKGDRLLYVERILTDKKGRPTGTETVQLVKYYPEEWNSRLWAFDPKHPDMILVYGNVTGNAKPDNRIVVKRLKFPEYVQGQKEFVFTDADVLQKFYVDEALPEGTFGPQNNILQGATIYDGILYLPVGVGTPNRPSILYLVDIENLNTEGKPYRYAWYDYTDVIPCEMEDMDVWRGRLICTTNSHGRVRPVFAFPMTFELKER